MKLVCSSLDAPFTLETERVNILQIETPALFARFAHAASLFFSEETQEPARLYSNDSEELDLKKNMFFVGDILHLDFADKQITSLLFKWIVKAIREHEIENDITTSDYALQNLLDTLLLELHGDYTFRDEWDAVKYSKMHGLAVDIVESDSLFDKALAFLNIASDFFPYHLLVFVHVRSYMSEEEYAVFAEQCIAQGLCVLLIESGAETSQQKWERGVFIDGNFIEKNFG